ncbi:DUF1850 domain-containing protein [Brevibacillus massiliensis]|jgi:hypothetical protein|uniref:DUF1850 domain-containing protein n=1 Tax=Brevibacillus massiliensis TaxID=1118054 RepID=UPI000363CD0B|nr:DUF1850 domain-containing protein [Brevibacillus massiliensis]
MPGLAQAKKSKGRIQLRLFSFLAVLLAVTITLLLFPFRTELVIRDTKTNRLLWQTPVKEGSTFGIRWTHSIHRTPVEEFYRIHHTDIVLYRMSFEDYGIGMNSELAPGEQLIEQDGKFFVEHMNHSFSALPIFIGQVRANHTLLFEGHEIPFRTLDKPGSSVTVKVENHSLLAQMGG